MKHLNLNTAARTRTPLALQLFLICLILVFPSVLRADTEPPLSTYSVVGTNIKLTYEVTGTPAPGLPGSAKIIDCNNDAAGHLSIPSILPGGILGIRVLEIDYQAFKDCAGLTSITIPSSISSIGNGAFAGCEGLTSITIPPSVTHIGSRAFFTCRGLTSIAIPSSVRSIGERAFYLCSLNSITIPSSVTSIGYGAFCTYSLHSIIVDPANPAYESDRGVLYDKNFSTLLQVPGSRSGEFSIPHAVTSIGDYAFHSCRGLTKVYIPDNVTHIGDHAFQQCRGLTSVTIPSSVTFIGDYAFADCEGLTSITIPSNVTFVGAEAFAYCYLRSAIFLGNAPILGAEAFFYDVPIYYVSGSTGFSSPTWQGYYSMPSFNGTTPSGLFPFVIENSPSTTRLGGRVVIDDRMPPTVLGVVYSAAIVNGNPRINGHGVDNVATTEIHEYFNITASSLTPGTEYVFSVYATNVFGTRYSSSVSFTTPIDPLSNFETTYGYCFVGTPYDLRIGNQVTFNFDRLITSEQTIKLSGKLPTGLKYNPETGLLTGTLSGKAGVYQTVVQIYSGRTLVHTIPFPITVLDFPSSLIGNFDAILEDVDGNPKGALHLSITKSNAWSATLESADTGKRSAKGTFILGEDVPTAPITAQFAATSTAPAVTILLTLDGDAANFTGTHNHGTLRGFRLARGPELPATTAVCTVVLDAGDQDGISSPAGFGWMKGNVSKAGIGALKGILGDGTAATITLRVSPSGQAVLWAQPYTNKNSRIGGIVTLSNIGLSPGDDSDLEEGARWLKLADDKTLSYPNGFGPLAVNVVSSRWIASSTASSLGASLGWRNDRTTSVTMQGAGISNQEPQATPKLLPTEFTMSDKFDLVASAPVGSSRVAWSGKATAKDGGFAGVLTIPNGFSSETGSGPAAASGVLLQDGPWESVTGCGLIKIPIAGVKGGFRTAAFMLGQ